MSFHYAHKIKGTFNRKMEGNMKYEIFASNANILSHNL